MPEVVDNPEVMFWYAITLASVGRVEDSLPLLKQVFTVNPIWRELVPRLVKAGLVSNQEQVVTNEIDGANVVISKGRHFYNLRNREMFIENKGNGTASLRQVIKSHIAQ